MKCIYTRVAPHTINAVITASSDDDVPFNVLCFVQVMLIFSRRPSPAQVHLAQFFHSYVYGMVCILSFKISFYKTSSENFQ